MQVQVNSDNTTRFSSALASEVEQRVRERLNRFAARLTRVEIHFRDLDGADTSRDEGAEAMLEVRPAGQKPVAVSHRARNPAEAISGGLSRLVARLDSIFGKVDRVR